MAVHDITDLLQTLEAFEDRAGVRFEGLSAFLKNADYKDGYEEVIVSGEVHPISGTTLECDTNIELTVIDSKGRVVATETDWVQAEKFFGFHTFTMDLHLVNDDIGRVRLIPKLDP